MRPLTILLFFSLPLAAEHYALLVGIGQYSQTSAISGLDGPPHDVESIRKVLIERAGYNPEHIRLLLNGEATKAAILSELDRLASTVQQGDYVVFFYSGHGTSNGDPSMRAYALDSQTGALLPADFQRGTRYAVVNSLIIGKRDLRPRFTRIQEKATLLALFDTCYSQDAAKDALVHPQPRYVPLSDLVSPAKSPTADAEFARDEQTDVAGMVEEPFPYRNVISLAAAARNQQAHDISLRQVQFRPESTVDHQPHGVFTNGLLAGLEGAADKNHDGVITLQEMYAYLLEKSVTWEQNPQMQYSKTNMALLDQPLFGGNRVASATQPGGPKTVSVQAAGINPQLRERISRLAGITVMDGEGDLLVKNGSHGGYLLEQGNGRALNRNELSADELVARIGAEPALRELISLSPRSSQSQVILTTVGDNFPSGQTVFTKGDRMKFEVQSPRPAYFLLLDIDPEGTVTVVYPAQSDPVTPVDASKPVILGKGGETTAPFGMEFLKLFAFEQKPPAYDTWRASEQERVKQFAPGSAEFGRLLMALKAQNEAGEIALRIITTDR